jgi:hypothetical protein
MNGRCNGDCRLVASVVRDMSKADDEELAAIQAAVSSLLAEHEARMGGDLITALCRWSEAAARHQERRADAPQPAVTRLAGKRAS